MDANFKHKTHMCVCTHAHIHTNKHPTHKHPPPPHTHAHARMCTHTHTPACAHLHVYNLCKTCLHGSNYRKKVKVVVIIINKFTYSYFACGRHICKSISRKYQAQTSDKEKRVPYLIYS